MGFFTGRVAFSRFRVKGRPPRQFGPEHLEKLAAHAIGRQRIVTADGVEIGWSAGSHILDTDFELDKTIVNDALHCTLRVDSQHLPADLLRAYMAIDWNALAAGNPSGLPSSRQRREARQAARDRLDAEARDGRYLRRKVTPILWDCQTGDLFIGTTGPTAVERVHGQFEQTFAHGFEARTAGRRAHELADEREQSRAVDDATPAAFVPGATGAIAWQPDDAQRDFLGNEFLLWLWYVLEAESDTLALADNSTVTVLLARTLTLECPRGQTGRQS